MSDHQTIQPAIRHDGWTHERRVVFLDHLAGEGNVRAACARAGMSAEAAYRLRRRDELFARAWAAALVLAREASAEVLATRAIQGVEEEIYYRGELVGSRRRYDTRLLLAHMARLDRLAEDDGMAARDSARFDQLLAANAGIEVPDDLADEEDAPFPATREEYAAQEGDRAEAALRDEKDPQDDRDWDELDDEEAEALNNAIFEFDLRCRQAAYDAELAAGERWDTWFTSVTGQLDTMIAVSAGQGAFTPCTPSTLSTSHTAPGALVRYARA